MNKKSINNVGPNYIILLGLTIFKIGLGPINISLIVLSWHDIIQGHKLFTKVMKTDCIYDNVP
jgi:hypothetical protein